MTHRYAGWLVGLLLGPTTLGFGQASSDQNYTLTNTLREAGHTNEATVPQLSAWQRQQQVTYYDGLGRPTQTVDWQASPAGYDVITPTVYDALGRTPRQYLPYVAGSNDATFHPAAVPEQSWFYQPGSSTGRNEKVARDHHPYAESVYEASPLNRVVEQGAAGQTWQPGQGHTLTFGERPNRNQEVRLLTMSGDVCAVSGHYGAGELWVKESRDEHGAFTLEFTDKLGQLVAKNVAPENGDPDQLTRYVYDDLQRLRLVLPPEASRLVPGGNIPDDFIARWCFAYRYDERGRLIEKRVPGAGVEEFVYNQRDQLVMRHSAAMSQDPTLPAGTDRWQIYKYDALGRLVATGHDRYSRYSRADYQSWVNSSTKPLYEVRDGSTVGYTSTNSYPEIAGTALEQVNYYDDYDYAALQGFAFQATPAISVPASVQSKLVRGQLTGTRVKVDGQQQYLVTANFYDAQYRLVQTLADNHLGGRDRLTNRYDNLDGRVRFGALVQQSYLEHETGNGQAHSIAQRFSYDHTGRLNRHEQNFDYQGDVVLARHHYNELGQLVDKELHSADAARTFLQSVDYRYNIRGWLTHINDRDLTNGARIQDWPADPDGANVQPDVFGLELKYESGSHLGATAQYNGNISEQLWQSRNDGVLRGYRYDYDRFNRLTAAPYRSYEHNGSGFAWGNYGTDFTLTGVSYDQNGNIQHLKRCGAPNGSNSNPNRALLDDLTYHYQGNQLVAVDDAEPPTATDHDFEDNGHKYSSSGVREYEYDASGNLTRDANKGITHIDYNRLLNLPTRLEFGNAGNRIEYTYAATGQKLQQRVYHGGYLDKTTDYVGSFVYENQQPAFVQMAEGRLVYESGIQWAGWHHEYHLKDHLGNLRVAFRPGVSNEQQWRRATMEMANAQTEEEQFEHVASTRRADAAHARTGQYEAALNAGAGRSEGPATEFAIVAGDSVHAEVYARYEHAAPRGRAWRSGAIVAGAAVAGSPGQLPREMGAVAPRRRFLPWLGASLAVVPQLLFNRGEEEEAVPEAYLHVDYYSADSQLVASQVQPVVRTSEDAWQPMHLEGRADSTGYVRVYVQSADSKNVYFDDLAARTTSVNLVQVNHYDPWGLNLVGIEQGGSPTSQFQYNGKEKQTDFGLNWTDHGARFYDAQLGRWHVVDPLTEAQEAYSPFHFGYNNPVRYNDLDGKMPDCCGEQAMQIVKQEFAKVETVIRDAGTAVNEVGSRAGQAIVDASTAAGQFLNKIGSSLQGKGQEQQYGLVLEASQPNGISAGGNTAKKVIKGDGDHLETLLDAAGSVLNRKGHTYRGATEANQGRELADVTNAAADVVTTRREVKSATPDAKGRIITSDTSRSTVTDRHGNESRPIYNQVVRGKDTLNEVNLIPVKKK